MMRVLKAMILCAMLGFCSIPVAEAQQPVSQEERLRILEQMYQDGMAAYDNGDFNASFLLFSQAAAGGHAEAQFSLGVSYSRGEGCAKDRRKAVEWYKKAAEQNHDKAIFNVAVAYDDGDGVKQDWTMAAKWYLLAAKQGHPEAQHNLGCCYENGSGVEKDLKEAESWFRKSAEQGVEQAKAALKRIGAE